MAKSILKKGIVRKIKTAEFEQLDVVFDSEDEIEWKTEQERQEKVKKDFERFLNDFSDLYNEAVKKIGVDRCIGVVNVKGTTNKSSIKNDSSNDLDFDFE